MASTLYSPRNTPGCKPVQGTLCNYAHPLRPTWGYALMERSGGQIQDLVAQRYDTGFVNNPTWTRDAGLHFVNASSQYIPLNTRKFLCNGTFGFFTVGMLLRWTSSTGNLFAYSEGQSSSTSTIVSLGTSELDGTKGRAFVMGDAGGSRADVSTSRSINDGRWHSLYFVARGDNYGYSLYLDGVLDGGFNPSSGGEAVTPNRRTLGALGRVAVGNYWDGDIGYVFGWDRALTAAQVASLSVNPFQWLHRPKFYALSRYLLHYPSITYGYGIEVEG